MTEIPEPSREDLILLFQFLGLVGRLNAEIREKEQFARQQDFENAAGAREREKVLREKLDAIQLKFNEISEKYAES